MITISIMKSVKHFMVDKDWKQIHLADALGITVSHVSLLLAGKRTPSVNLLQKLSKITSIPVEKLITEAGKPQRKRT